jgi:hypothetical protein
MNDTPAKATIVTDASGGVGRAVALRLAGDDFVIVVNCIGIMPLGPIAEGDLEDFDSSVIEEPLSWARRCRGSRHRRPAVPC